jgi:RND family efflux transporter MFP subunit
VSIAALAALFFLGLIPRLNNSKDLDRTEAATVKAIRIVHTVTVKPAPFTENGFIPGNISAIQEASIFARVDGYLKTRLIDIGDRVKAGQLIAEIETPTVDAEVAQAKADLAQAHASLASARAKLKEAKAQDQAAQAQVEKAQSDLYLTKVTADRWEKMADGGAVTMQSRDEKVTSYAAQSAQVKSAEAQKAAADQNVASAESDVKLSEATVQAKVASLNRYLATQSFKYVRAPFDGVITYRKVDPGALITSGSQSASQQLFEMAQIEHLRIYIDVPQTISMFLEPGQKAEIHVTEYPGRTFPGLVSNVSGALDQNTRTRQTEVRIENKDHALLPGMYAQVKIQVQRPDKWVSIPGPSLIPLDNGMNVVVVQNNKAHFQKVVIGRDFGDTVEIRAGLNDNDIVVVSPPVDLREGEPVNPVPIPTR